MGKRDKGQAAARACAGRATIQNITGMGNQVRLPELKPHTQPTTDSEPDAIGNESDGECGYTGGVNCDFYSDGEEGDWSDDNDLEQLDEMEGEELENNLQALKAAMDLLEVPSRNPTIFDQISRHHSLKDWENAEKELALAGGAFVMAGSLSEKNENPLNRFLEKLIPFGAILFSITMISFGILHFLYAKDVADYIPAWVPNHMFWAYFAGTALIGSGIAIILKIKLRLIAALLGAMIFTWFIMLHIPKVIAASSADIIPGKCLCRSI